MRSFRNPTWFITAGKWTPGPNASNPSSALFVETAKGAWKGMVDEDGHWSVRGPDPDDPLHYASGDVSTADADVKVGGAKGRMAAARKRARSYIMNQIKMESP